MAYKNEFRLVNWCWTIRLSMQSILSRRSTLSLHPSYASLVCLLFFPPVLLAPVPPIPLFLSFTRRVASPHCTSLHPSRGCGCTPTKQIHPIRSGEEQTKQTNKHTHTGERTQTNKRDKQVRPDSCFVDRSFGFDSSSFCLVASSLLSDRLD